MRITFGMLTDRARTDLMQSAEGLMNAQARAASGKRIHRPSDDVPGVGRALSLRSALASVEQYDRNSGVASNLLSVTDDTLTSIVNRIQDAVKQALSAANATVTPEARQGIATQITQIADELQSLANTQYLGNYIFAGTLSGSEAIVENAAGTPPCVFQGDTTDFKVQIAPGTFITANVTADKVFNMGGAAEPGTPDLFATLKSLKDNVLAGDVTAISNQIAEVKTHLSNVTSIRSQVGGRIQRLESTNEALGDSRLKIMDLLSKTEDADLAEAIVDLQTRQNIYQAAISAANRILEMSLTNMWG